MKKLITIAAIAAIAGCMSITVEDYGYDVVRDSEGAPIVAKDGTVQKVHKGQRWSYFKHWVNSACEKFDFSRKPGDDISISAANYKDEVSAELNKLIETSFKGAAELAAQVGAAIATYGASTAGQAGMSALAKTIKSYVSKGGSVENAKVTCDGANCTITDGSITETCTNCLREEGACTDNDCPGGGCTTK